MIPKDKIKRIIKLAAVCITSLISLFIIINCLNGNIQFKIFNTYFAGLGFISSEIRYDYSGFECKNKEFPLIVIFKNNSFRQIGRISFSIIANIPGHTTNLVAGPFHISGDRTSDKIIDIFNEDGICSKIPELSIPEDPTALIWSIKINKVEFN